MRHGILIRLAALLALTGLSAVVIEAMGRDDEQKHPVYIGAKACAACHRGKSMGDQHAKWLLSKHSRAHATLANPESTEIARLSGIPHEPQSSAVCLGCHATGSEAEDWEKDPAFRIADGVQCEMCHGPGSEYADAKVMRNAKTAAAGGLIMPTKKDCMGCHLPKGSHVAVLRKATIDIDKAWDKISHLTPAVAKLPPKVAPPQTKDQTKRPKYTGVRACAACHRGRAKGYQASKWRTSAHARAHAVLTTSKADDIAKKMGVKGYLAAAPACLRCHATGYLDPAGGASDSYAVSDGVGCQACHGPGGKYSDANVMKNKKASKAAGLIAPSRKTCLPCHEKAHGKKFDFDKALKQIAHPTKLPKRPEPPRYKTPLNMAISPNGKELYVACEASHTVIVVDTATRRKVAEIKVGHHPTDVTFSPDGKRAYVSNRLDDSVSVIQVEGRKVASTISVGDEPHGVLTDRSGKRLYVLNTSSDSISVIDTAALKEIKRLEASRSPWSLSLSPDASQIYITNALSRFVKFRKPPMSEVTAIDTGRAVVTNRLSVPAANLVQGVDWHPSGKFAIVTLNRTKNLVPMTRLLQGWTITNGLGVAWRDGRVDQVLLDEPNMCFPDPADVAITPDGKLALVTSSGSDRVAVVSVPKLIATIENASARQRKDVLPNHLGKPTEFVIKHIPTRNSPRGVVITADGATSFVANSLDDSLTVIDLKKLQAVGRIDLGGPKIITKTRRGERLFHSANITFRRQFSCHSCHPDGHVDGLSYDIEPDGLGSDPVDNRTLRGILDTAPFKWTGLNPSLSRQCGPRLAVFFTRIQPFEPDELSALTDYICSIPRPPNRYRPLGAKLSGPQRRGKAMFDRTKTNDGRIIPKSERCVTCHRPPLYTDRRKHDVGTKMRLDTKSNFDTPHLTNIYDSAPYMHNGIADTLEEIWTKYNPYDKHGVTNDMTKDQLNDLIEFLKTL
ncbi:MAG: multiheme c-type cytochrome [Phycisphaerae bacterium]|jgi:YVTN family beta-propeller protein|nr:multiheme c-type cytochrome [Phycisphaerae bacterium]